MMIWPNPGSEEVNVSWNASGNRSARIEIYSMVGELLRSESATLTPFKIPTDDLPTGCYTIRLINEEGRSAVKWLKQ